MEKSLCVQSSYALIFSAPAFNNPWLSKICGSTTGHSELNQAPSIYAVHELRLWSRIQRTRFRKLWWIPPRFIYPQQLLSWDLTMQSSQDLQIKRDFIPASLYPCSSRWPFPGRCSQFPQSWCWPISGPAVDTAPVFAPHLPARSPQRFSERPTCSPVPFSAYIWLEEKRIIN